MGPEWRIPVLTYHGLHCPGWSYQENDHVALEQDLVLIKKLGYRVAPLDYLVKLLKGQSDSEPANHKLVALSFDDGTDLDYEDFYHEDYGYLKSFRNILLESPGLGLDGGYPQATSFVIASPDAREELDRTCIAGRGQWRDQWWADSALNGPISIANHSWDHTHQSLQEIVVASIHKGRFDSISDFESADEEILRAERYIRKITNQNSLPFFAYPYGHYNDFLIEEYFPAREKYFAAAFITSGRFVAPSDSCWTIPRLVCGEHWKSPDELATILLM